MDQIITPQLFHFLYLHLWISLASRVYQKDDSEQQFNKTALGRLVENKDRQIYIFKETKNKFEGVVLFPPHFKYTGDELINNLMVRYKSSFRLR